MPRFPNEATPLFCFWPYFWLDDHSCGGQPVLRAWRTPPKVLEGHMFCRPAFGFSTTARPTLSYRTCCLQRNTQTLIKMLISVFPRPILFASTLILYGESNLTWFGKLAMLNSPKNHSGNHQLTQTLRSCQFFHLLQMYYGKRTYCGFCWLDILWKFGRRNYNFLEE